MPGRVKPLGTSGALEWNEGELWRVGSGRDGRRGRHYPGAEPGVGREDPVEAGP